MRALTVCLLIMLTSSLALPVDWQLVPESLAFYSQPVEVKLEKTYALALGLSSAPSFRHAFCIVVPHLWSSSSAEQPYQRHHRCGRSAHPLWQAVSAVTQGYAGQAAFRVQHGAVHRLCLPYRGLGSCEDHRLGIYQRCTQHGWHSHKPSCKASGHRDCEPAMMLLVQTSVVDKFVEKSIVTLSSIKAPVRFADVNPCDGYTLG